MQIRIKCDYSSTCLDLLGDEQRYEGHQHCKIERESVDVRVTVRLSGSDQQSEKQSVSLSHYHLHFHFLYIQISHHSHFDSHFRSFFLYEKKQMKVFFVN